MKNALHLIRHHFSWNKSVFWTILAVTMLTALSLRIIPGISSFATLIIFFNGFVAFAYVAVASLVPAVPNAVSTRFSWKFFLGIPLTKKEVLFSMALASLISSFPLIFYILIYGGTIAREMEIDFNPLKFAVNLGFAAIFIGLSSVKQQVEFPRKEESRRHPLRSFIKYMRFVMVFMASLFLAIAIIAALESAFHWKVFEILISLTKNAVKIATSWLSTVFFIGICLHRYYDVLGTWANEQITYKKQIWKPFKEYSLLVVSSLIVCAVTVIVNNHPPDVYIGDIQTAVFRSEYDKLQTATKEQLNKPNHYGFTPMMVAVSKADLKMIQFLEKRGAGYEGEVVKHSLKGFDNIMLAVYSRDLSVLKYVASKMDGLIRKNQTAGFYPLHFASAKCQSDMVDFIIEQKADVNVLNKDGETPLIVAARANCFSAAVSLKEAGADFKKRDNAGKFAVDKIPDKDKNSEFVYYIRKNMRAPAATP